MRVLASSLLLFVPVLAQAAAGGGFAGLQGGVAFPSTSSAAFTFGANILYQNSPRIGFEAVFLNYGLSIEATDGGASSSSESTTTLYGVGIHYLFDGPLVGTRVGLRSGFLSGSLDVSASSGSDSVAFSSSTGSFLLMPMLSYDHALTKVVSLGAEAGFVWGIGADAPTAVTVMFAPKIWF